MDGIPSKGWVLLGTVSEMPNKGNATPAFFLVTEFFKVSMS
jgi:hypothetical protein